MQGTFDELVSRPNSLLSAVVATYESEAKDAYDEAKVVAVVLFCVYNLPLSVL